jgi:hypothetical protein
MSFFEDVRFPTIHSRNCFVAIFSIFALSAHSFGGCSLDVDGDGETLATTDHLILMRYALGIRGAPLIANALGPTATRTTPVAVETYIATPCRQPGWVGDGTGRLNDTGILFGGNALTGNNAGCTGANIAQQDCSKGRDVSSATNSNANGKAGFHFTKISNSGSKLPATAVLGSGANDWACTYDNTTGLMWEVKTTSGLRSSAHTYSWFSSDATNNGGLTGVANGGTCFNAGQCDTEKFVQAVNSVGLCGRNDWRMPHVNELFGLADLGGGSPAMIDPAFFPNTPGAFTWSGSPFATTLSPGSAWVVNFDGASINDALLQEPRNALYFVRLVRTGL